MMKNLIVVVDGRCGPCSSLGKELSGIRGTKVISADSEEAASLGVTSQAPCAVEITGSGDQHVYRGWAMRMRLARQLGLKQTGRWFSLLGAELHARQMRTQGGLSRRAVLAGGVLTGLTAVFGAHSATQAAAAPQQASVRALPEPTFTKALALIPKYSVIKSADVHEAYLVGSGDARSVAFITASGLSLIIPEKHPEAALAMTSRDKSLWFATADGMPIVELTPTNGKVTTRAPEQSVTTAPTVFQAQSTSQVEPQSIKTFAACVAACSGKVVSYNCLLAYCIPPSNPACFLCGGTAVVACAIDCA